MNGFEFTHHDVLADINQREKFVRRYKRLFELQNENLFIFYHHRQCNGTNRKMLIDHLYELKKIYKKRC